MSARGASGDGERETASGAGLSRDGLDRVCTRVETRFDTRIAGVGISVIVLSAESASSTVTVEHIQIRVPGRRQSNHNIGVDCERESETLREIAGLRITPPRRQASLRRRPRTWTRQPAITKRPQRRHTPRHRRRRHRHRRASRDGHDNDCARSTPKEPATPRSSEPGSPAKPYTTTQTTTNHDKPLTDQTPTRPEPNLTTPLVPHHQPSRQAMRLTGPRQRLVFRGQRIQSAEFGWSSHARLTGPRQRRR